MRLRVHSSPNGVNADKAFDINWVSCVALAMLSFYLQEGGSVLSLVHLLFKSRSTRPQDIVSRLIRNKEKVRVKGQGLQFPLPHRKD